jgi:hypothetical protein
MDAGIKASDAFFAPLTGIDPLSGFPPLIINLSNACSFHQNSVG